MIAAIDLATLLAALGAGLIAGVFFAFSSFVMGALARLPAAQGIAAMQSINRVVLNPAFLGAFFGTGALALALGIYALIDGKSAWLPAGALLYLVGTIGVTALGNVPRNNALTRLAPDDPASAAPWARYVVEWTWWNHVRTAAALLAAACFMLALI
ncbi:anthrone oxygenase family protein [Desertibaculum subflavum]|uniref:anthrone oxygenase family protein n=1 Tax=Desertibaculum subflavum TaxID=2268458 RepID=UPI000E675F6E